MDDEITTCALLAADGDRAAAERFVAATRTELHRLLSYLSDPRSAEDLAQETYLRAFAALPGFEARSPARMWLFAIARRVAADHLRSRSRRPRAVQEPVGDEIVPGSPDHGRLVVLHELICALDDERREAFVLTQVAGLSYAEAAEVCGCPVGTVRSRVFRARDELATALGREEGRAATGP